MTSAVSQYQVDHITGLLLNNAKLEQKGGKSRVAPFNANLGWVGTSGDDPVVQLASVSKVLILLEMARALGESADVAIPFTIEMRKEAEERDPKRVRRLRDLYSRNSMPISEVFYQVAAMSSNSATQGIKLYRGNAIGNMALQAAYERLAPSYQMLESLEGNHHWTEERPNTGRISEVAEQLDLLVRRVFAGTANPLEEILANSLLNNETDFRFCFTHSKFGKELRRKGYQIYEKTGYYPAVTWIRYLAEQGWPTVLVLATIVTIVTPEGAIHTFWYNVNTEVVHPWESITEEGVEFPDEWAKGYKAYVAMYKSVLDRTFREVMVTEVKRQLYS